MFRIEEYIDECHLLNATQDYYEELKNLVPVYTIEDERNWQQKIGKP